MMRAGKDDGMERFNIDVHISHIIFLEELNHIYIFAHSIHFIRYEAGCLL